MELSQPDHNRLERTLTELAASIQDPANRILFHASTVAGKTAMFKLPPGHYQKSFVNVSEMLNRRPIRNLLVDACDAVLSTVLQDSSLTTVLTHSGAAEILTNCLRPRIKEINGDMTFYTLPLHEDRGGMPNLSGKNVLILTDIVQTGQCVRLMADLAIRAGARAVSVFTALILSRETEFFITTAVSSGVGNTPVYKALRIPIQIFSNPPESGKILIPEELFTNFAVNQPYIINVFSEINETVKTHLASHPEHLYNLSPRNFEELVAAILKDFGFEVALTQTTRDGGRDIIAYIRNAVCSVLTYVECKKHAPDRRVGVEVVRSLYGVQTMHKANKSLIVTTSFFTKDAIKEAQHIGDQMELKDYNALKMWLSRYRQ